MVLSDNLTVHEPFDAGYATCPYYAAVDGAAIEDVDHFSNITLQHQPDPGEFFQNDFDFKAPSSTLMARHADPRGHLFDRYAVYRHPGHYTQAQMGHGQLDAQMELERLQVYQERVVLGGRVRGAAPGHSLTVTGAPRAELNRELLIVSASYDIRDNAYRAQRSATPSHFAVTVEAIARERQYRPQLRTPIPRTSGPEMAIVVGPEGEEIHTDEYGRARVRMPWHRHSKGDGKDTAYIPVCQPWAGDQFGAVFLPRVGQQVLVDFERGNPDRMVCIGRLANAENMPPWALPANKTQSGILTRSSPGGSPDNANALRFEDKKGAEEVWLHAEKDQRIEVENDESHWVGHDRRKTIDNDETTQIGRDRTELVKRHETIEIQGERKELVHLNETITIKQDRTELVMWDESITIKKNRGTWVELNESVGVGKNRTMSIGKSETLTVGDNKKDSIGKNLSVKVGKTKTETIKMTSLQTVGLGRVDVVGLGYSLNVGGLMNTMVGLSQTEQVILDKSVTVGGDSTHNAGANIVIEAVESITFKSGESALIMKADGTVTVTCKVLELTGSEHIQLTSELIDQD